MSAAVETHSEIITLPPFLAALNARQREAAEKLDGPVLVLAGAGTGKTKVLTARLANLLFSGRATPFQILAVTFTNKAAREMSHRVGQLLGRPTEGWYLGTFHSIGARLLRQYAERVGLKPNFTILDDSDQLRLLKQILADHNIEDKKWPARLVLAMISRYKDKGIKPEEAKQADAAHAVEGKLPQLYAAYQQRLRELNACDFGDLLLYNLLLLREHADVLAELQQRFRYILVDEYQDTNLVQYLWLRLLSQQHQNLCCVGDDDQSIYSWRGAEIGNILRFEQDFQHAYVVRLEQNYRSTGHILAAASVLIAQNAQRLGKTLWTEADAGEKLSVRALWDGESEARYVSDEIESLQRRGISLADIAILSRTAAQTREFEERFIKTAIPYRVVGGTKFYERVEVRDALAYLRLVLQPQDDLAFERIVNVPRRGVGPATLQQITRLARQYGQGMLFATAQLVGTDEIGAKTRQQLNNFLQCVQRWRDQLQHLSPAELTELVLEESGYLAMLQADKSVESAGRIDNLKELVNAISEFDTLSTFLEHVSLVMEQSSEDHVAKVTLMTIHAAKGLEFSYVFLAGWEEELFPSRRTLEESGVRGLEEERRLAYVALTRAKTRAYVMHATQRRLHGQWLTCQPSRFIAELPKEHIEQSSEITQHMSPPAPMWSQSYQSHNNFSRGNGKNYQQQIEGRADVIDADSYQSPLVGERVFHTKFGYGVIRRAEGDRLEIAFERAGLKKVMSSFVVSADRAGEI